MSVPFSSITLPAFHLLSNCASAPLREMILFNQKSSASDFFKVIIRLTTARVLECSGLAELSFSIRVVRSLAAGMKRESGARTPHSISTRLVVIRLIRGLNIHSFQLQNHSTSLMPIRRIGLRQRVSSFIFLRAFA